MDLNNRKMKNHPPSPFTTDYTKCNQTFIIFMHLATYLEPVDSLAILNLLNVLDLMYNLSLIFVCLLLI